MSAAAVVTAVSMAGAVVSPPPEWDYARIDRDLSDYHFAYYAQSPEADLRVLGNGVDIVGFFEKQLEGDEPYVIVHATNEHSNNACENDLAYILRIQRSG